ncbi:MAG TPA: hypothetical protein VGQ37_02685 [Vicinamibacterales bacterium]|jgi:hypothetical protein|nr:hypothetical protein [Vicinamibacterales bacterium]
MRKLHTLAAALTIASVGVTGAAAQGKGNAGAPKAPKAPTTTVSHGNAGGGSTHGSAPTKGPSQAPKSGGSQASNTTTTGSGHGGGAGKGNTKTTTVTASVTTDSGSTSGSTTTTTTTTTAVAPPNALSTKLAKNPQQLARLTGMLPEGMTIEQATTGFRNQGQFIAALNASKNQGVSFADLQTAMTVDGLSLGQAVKQLRNAPPEAPEAPAAGGTTTGGTTTGS